MGWGTTFTAELYISRQIYRTKSDVEEGINEIKEDMNNIREKILMYCASGIKGFEPKDCEGEPLNPVEWMHHELKGLFNDYDGLSHELEKLKLLLLDWNEDKETFNTAEYD